MADKIKDGIYSSFLPSSDTYLGSTYAINYYRSYRYGNILRDLFFFSCKMSQIIIYAHWEGLSFVRSFGVLRGCKRNINLVPCFCTISYL